MTSSCRSRSLSREILMDSAGSGLLCWLAKSTMRLAFSVTVCASSSNATRESACSFQSEAEFS